MDLLYIVQTLYTVQPKENVMAINGSPTVVQPPTRPAGGGHRLTAGLLIGGAVAVNLAFLGLGAVFDYPNVLNKPADQVLATFAANQVVISLWFLLLAAGAGLLAPIAIRVGRLGTSTALRISVPIGITAAAVQVTGLLRWPLLVPGLAARAGDAGAADSFDSANLWLGTVLGESMGYALTAMWTVLVAVGLRRSVFRGSMAGRILLVSGILSAALIAAGIVEPFDVPAAGLANFAGYVIWSGWLVALAVMIVRGAIPAQASHTVCEA
jgi:hypothetical protein